MLCELTILAALLCPQGSEAERKVGLEPAHYGPGGWPVRTQTGRGYESKSQTARPKKPSQKTPFDAPSTGRSAARPSRKSVSQPQNRAPATPRSSGLKGAGKGKSSLDYQRRRRESTTPIRSRSGEIIAPVPLAETSDSGRSGRGAFSGEPSTRSNAGETGLRDVFRALGTPDDFSRLGGLHAMMRFRVLNDDGSELGLLKVRHDMDLSRARRDRLMFESDLVYGRDGSTVFVEYHGNPRPSRVPDARSELEILGLLARFPWCFADPDAFMVEDPVEVGFRGRTRSYKIHVESRVHSPQIGRVRRGAQKPDVYDIFCDERMLPFRLVYTLASTGSERQIKLSDYRNHGKLRIAGLREILDADERTALEISIQMLTTHVTLPESEFRPSR